VAEESGAAMESELKLKDGAEVRIREARPEDRPALESMFRACSPETLYTRFLSPGLGVPLRYLDRLMLHRPPRVVSLVAETRDHGEPRIVALMNFVETEPGARGEIAIVVVDDHQNRGLGSAMLQHLYQMAAGLGIKKLVADIDAGNRRVFHLIQRSSLPCQIRIDQGVAHAELEIEPT